MRRTAVLIGWAAFLLLVSTVLVQGEDTVRVPPRANGLGERAAMPHAETASTTSYDLSWWTIDGGGTTSDGGSGYTLGGTAGQLDAAVWSGGDYTLTGGFWGGAAAGPHAIYLPLVIRNS